jgi:rare lipoprotein A
VRTFERLLLALAFLLLLTSCAHKQARVEVPPPPPTADTQTRPAGNLPASPPLKQPQVETSATKSEDEVISLPADAQPLSTETGMASWYGAPYHNRTGSNGKVYNMHAMTAAHRTLPLGSIVRVTNLKTGHSALLRITDRGPFVAGRILDLSYAAAKQLDVWQPGVASVKVEVMQTPASKATGGRWAVQIGSFENQKEATELADHLAHRYHTAKVAKFASPIGDWWVRVRVLHDDRKRAEELIRETTTTAVAAYLVRLD